MTLFDDNKARIMDNMMKAYEAEERQNVFQLKIKDHDQTIFTANLTNRQAVEVMNLLKLKDSTIDPCSQNEVRSYRAGTNPGD